MVTASGSVVDDEVHPGRFFYCSDVPSFSANETTLHLIVWQWHCGESSFGDHVGRETLDRLADDLSCGVVGPRPRLVLHVAVLKGQFVLDFLLGLTHQL